MYLFAYLNDTYFRAYQFSRIRAKKVQNARKLVPNLRSKGSARKLIRFKIKIFLLKNYLPNLLQI